MSDATGSAQHLEVVRALDVAMTEVDINIKALDRLMLLVVNDSLIDADTGRLDVDSLVQFAGGITHSLRQVYDSLQSAWRAL